MRNPLELLIGSTPEGARNSDQTFRWATVTDGNPLRVRLDSDPEPIAATPLTLVGNLSAGDRVFVLRMGRRMVVLGRGSGIPSVNPGGFIEQIYHALAGTTRKDGLLAKLRSGILDPTQRTVVVTAGSSTIRAQEARIGMADRLAFAAGATSFPLLDDLASRPTTGMNWLQGGEGGTRAENYLPEARLQKIDLADPDYVIHSIGSSDYAAQRPLSSYKTWMREACERIEADTPGVVNILVHQQARPDYPNLPVSWETYGQALKEVAEENPNRLFVDVNAMLDLYTVGIPGNRFDLVNRNDNVHPSNQGHKAIADILARELGIPMGQPSSEEYREFLLSGGTHTAGIRLFSYTPVPVSYPRLVTMVASLGYRASNNNSTGNWNFQLGRANDFNITRVFGDSVESTAVLTKTVYLAPMEEEELYLSALRYGATTLVVHESSSMSNVQITERPY